jgi:hypothetical protein
LNKITYHMCDIIEQTGYSDIFSVLSKLHATNEIFKYYDLLDKC